MKKSTSVQKNEYGPVDSPCFDKLSNMAYKGELKLLRRSGNFQNTSVKYPCGHRMERFMIFRWPDILLGECKDLIVHQAKFTSLRNFILFDPRDAIVEKIPKVVDRCPQCFFEPLLRAHATCCFCDKPLETGEPVWLHGYSERNSRKLGVLRTKYNNKSWLVRCSHGACGRVKKKGTLLAWDGEKLLEYQQFVERSKQSRHAA